MGGGVCVLKIQPRKTYKIMTPVGLREWRERFFDRFLRATLKENTRERSRHVFLRRQLFLPIKAEVSTG